MPFWGIVGLEIHHGIHKQICQSTVFRIALFYSCSRPEEKVSIPVGMLQKQVKTAEEKQRELQEDIRKKQEELKKQEARSQMEVNTYLVQYWSNITVLIIRCP